MCMHIGYNNNVYCLYYLWKSKSAAGKQTCVGFFRCSCFLVQMWNKIEQQTYCWKIEMARSHPDRSKAPKWHNNRQLNFRVEIYTQKGFLVLNIFQNSVLDELNQRGIIVEDGYIRSGSHRMTLFCWIVNFWPKYSFKIGIRIHLKLWKWLRYWAIKPVSSP